MTIQEPWRERQQLIMDDRVNGDPTLILPGVLCDWMIRNRLKRTDGHRLVIDPFSDYGVSRKDQISFGLTSGGYDLRVGNKFMVFPNTAGCLIHPKRFPADKFTYVEVPDGEDCVIPPNSFALAESVEYLEIPNDVMVLGIGKSTYARIGIIVPITPIECGWRGKVTIEISNTTPLPAAIVAGEGIFQLLFLPLAGAPERLYGDKPNPRYQDQKGLTLPRGSGE